MWVNIQDENAANILSRARIKWSRVMTLAPIRITEQTPSQTIHSQPGTGMHRKYGDAWRVVNAM